MANDTQLVRRCLSGEQEAFRLIVERYQGYVFAIILNLVREKDQAENIAQEVFFQIYRSLHQYRNENFKSWIGKIAVTKAIDWSRKKKRQSKEEIVADVEVVGGEVRDSSQTPEELLLQKERRERIREVCDCLPEIYRRMMIKFYLEEKSYQEIAREEGTGVKTVESRLYRGRILFRQEWRRERDDTL
ncbi:MAG: sigma-70 family RNA polymerase sigma factor [Dehalobacterium sp.]